VRGTHSAWLLVPTRYAAAIAAEDEKPTGLPDLPPRRHTYHAPCRAAYATAEEGLDWRQRRWFAWYAIVSPHRLRDLGRTLTHMRRIRGLSAVHSYSGSADTMSPFGVLTTLLRGASRRALDSKHGPIGYYKGAERAHRRS